MDGDEFQSLRERERAALVLCEGSLQLPLVLSVQVFVLGKCENVIVFNSEGQRGDQEPENCSIFIHLSFLMCFML